eukprot:scaffold116626_cov16-Tisochrysis_lutea.AAC.1
MYGAKLLSHVLRSAHLCLHGGQKRRSLQHWGEGDESAREAGIISCPAHKTRMQLLQAESSVQFYQAHNALFHYLPTVPKRLPGRLASDGALHHGGVALHHGSSHCAVGNKRNVFSRMLPKESGVFCKFVSTPQHITRHISHLLIHLGRVLANTDFAKE